MSPKINRGLTFIFTLLLLYTVASSQTAIGVTAGFGMADLKIESPDYSTRFRTSFYAGGFIRQSLTSALSLQGELVYAAEGANTSSTIVAGDGGHIRSSYLQIPVLLQWRTSSGIYVEAGPQISYMLSFEETWNGNKQDNRDKNKAIEFRLPAGLGYQFSGSLSGWSVRGRYSFSLMPINKSENGIPDVKAQAVSFGVLYELRSR